MYLVIYCQFSDWYLASLATGQLNWLASALTAKHASAHSERDHHPAGRLFGAQVRCATGIVLSGSGFLAGCINSCTGIRRALGQRFVWVPSLSCIAKV